MRPQKPRVESCLVLTAIASLFTAVAQVHAQPQPPEFTWHVDASAAPGGAGLTWATAFDNLQTALGEATESQGSDLVKVAQGTYWPDPAAPDPKEATFFLDFVDVTIQGGYAGITEPDPDLRDVDLYVTILDGRLPPEDPPGGCGGPGTIDCFLANPGIGGCEDAGCCEAVCAELPLCCLQFPTGWDQDCANAAFAICPSGVYHVVTAVGVDSRVRLDGVTITGGSARGAAGAPSFFDRGGGMLIDDASPIIVECTFQENGASTGGAMAIRSTNSASEPLLVNCGFFRNRITGDGAAVRLGAGSPLFTVDMGAFENADCQPNGTHDEEELVGNDVNEDGIPDDCQNCNGGPLDFVETAGGTGDCNANRIPDECEIADGCSIDEDQDGVPDECQIIWQLRAQFADPREEGSGIEGAAASLINGKLYVSHGNRHLPGEDVNDTDYLSIYDFATDTWTHGGVNLREPPVDLPGGSLWADRQSG